MIDPVVVASGQTYEKKYITEWLKYEPTCPKTKAVLSDLSLRQNLLVDELTEEWCRVNKYERRSEEKVTELDTDGIKSMLHRIFSPSSVSDQTEAANELRRQTTNFANVLDLFVAQIPNSINWLLSPFSALDGAVYSNTELQENLITALHNISRVEKNKTVIAENHLVIPVLTESLKKGTIHTQRISAGTLWLLSGIESNKRIIGKSEALVALIHLIRKEDLVATRAAASAVYNLCTVLENRERAIAEGFINELLIQIGKENSVDGLVALSESISKDNSMIEVMGNVGVSQDMLSILRRQSSRVTALNAVLILSRICKGNKDRLGELKTDAPTHTHTAVQTAEAILGWLKRIG